MVLNFGDVVENWAQAARATPGSEITEGDSAAAVMGKVLSAVQDALNNAYHMLSEQEIIRAADLLRRAGQVVCLDHQRDDILAHPRLLAYSPRISPISLSARIMLRGRWKGPFMSWSTRRKPNMSASPI